MKLTYIKQAGEPNGDAGDQYTGLDRFGRVVDQRWPQGSSELERVDYGFTAASNRQWRQNLVAATGQDEYYNYDGLYQVAELNRGTLNSGKSAIAGTPSWTEDFTYDPIGNWDAYLTKVSGVTDLDQSRTHNTANETVEIDGSTDTVAHDLAGNMTMVPQVADWESTFELKWDAWNRLVEVVDGETTVAQYRYDGKTRRVSKEVDAVRHYYYSDRWQILEERVDEETTAERQFLWGQRYLDDLVLRDRDVDHDGSLDERLYVLSDYFNPTAIADEDGVVVERYGYNAFGLSRVMDADFEPRSSSDYDWETRYGAYRWDGETGFHQVRFRYLHPTLGRWLSRDPLQELGNVLLYGYAANNALNRSDKLGLLTPDRAEEIRQCCIARVKRLLEANDTAQLSGMIIQAFTFTSSQPLTAPGYPGVVASELIKLGKRGGDLGFAMLARAACGETTKVNFDTDEKATLHVTASPGNGPILNLNPTSSLFGNISSAADRDFLSAENPDIRAALLAHELGHLYIGLIDSYNVYVVENTIRKSLGIPLRPSYLRELEDHPNQRGDGNGVEWDESHAISPQIIDSARWWNTYTKSQKKRNAFVKEWGSSNCLTQ